LNEKHREKSGIQWRNPHHTQNDRMKVWSSAQGSNRGVRAEKPAARYLSYYTNR
jgi:hypothetical protein